MKEGSNGEKKRRKNMKYDVGLHIPTQVENLVDAYQKADVDTMNRCLDMIYSLEKNKEFRKNIDEYKQERESQLKSIEKMSINTLDEDESKTMKDILISFETIKNKYVSDMGKLEQEYWKTIVEYITGFYHEEQKPGPVEEIGYEEPE